ncbi:uncharacterized protein LOC128138637 isoform X2 [Harpia harpyja]|uniref:uncharacterized protein LOC128138637 isoform X2 n=1 Tax=Harpia harpyja TaxID=202280 RepID=UPI0022B1F37D|nr:uncharacterized protein LOC128138637 isoform X2 [Harpia harpyja]
MMTRGAGTAFSRKSSRLSLGPEKSKLTGTGLHRLCRRRTTVDLDRAVPVADGHPTAQPDLVREPQGNPTDVAGRNGYPASQLGSRADTQGDRTGPQRAKHKAKAEIGKSSQWSPEVLKEILKELDKAAREMDCETVEKEAFQEGDSDAVPVSDEKTGAIQSTGVPVAVLSSPGEAHHARRYEFSPKNAGVDGKRNTNGMDPQDFRYYCIEGAVAVLGSVLFGMILCCVIRVWRKRQRRLSAASRARHDTSSCSSGLDSPSSRPSTPESWTRRQKPSPVPGKPARLPQSTRERASASPDSRPARPPPPRPPWLSNSASRVLRDQPSDLEPPEELQPPARAPSPSRRPSCKGLSQPRQGMGLGYGDRLLTDSFRDRPFMSE